MVDKDKNNGLFFTGLMILIIFVSLVWGIYSSYGHKVVTDIFNGDSYAFLNGIIGSQSIHTLEFYLQKADMLFLKFMFFALYLCFCAIAVIFTRDSESKVKTLVFLFAAGVAMNSQFISYLSSYIINDDVRQHTWWMRQFQDKQLFKGDLMALYFRNIQPWGFLAVYYSLSFVMDPVVAGKVLPPLLLGVSAVYFYKVIRYVTNDITTAVLGGFIFSITPIFLRQMVGAHARGFAFPLMIMFIFYIVKKDYLRSFILIVIQSLFYPVTAVLCGLTYFFSFIGSKDSGISFDASKKKMLYFVLAFIVAASILFGKQFLTYDQQVGSPVSRSEAGDKAEFYNERWPLLPTPSISQELAKNLEKGVFIFRSCRKIAAIKHLQSVLQDRKIFLILGLLFGAGLFVFRKVFPVPKEIYYLLLSGTIMYKMADIFFLKLYSPRRYLEYSAPLVSVFIFVLFVTALISVIRNDRSKRGVRICLFIFVFLNFNISSNEALIDMSENKGLYEYLSAIPESALVGAHPDLADGVPTFSKRKVFVARDMSVPLFNNYWKTVKQRTFDLFTAYYSDNPDEIYDFCIKNDINYLVVDRRHFNRTYILGGVYFEPFNSYVIRITKGRDKFVLNNIPDEYKLYQEGDIFVISVEKIKEL